MSFNPELERLAANGLFPWSENELLWQMELYRFHSRDSFGVA